MLFWENVVRKYEKGMVDVSRNWKEVYAGQKIILGILSGMEDIFLAGGTALQCYTLPEKWRESEDLDFFLDHELTEKEYAKLSRQMIQILENNKDIREVRHVYTEDGTHRLFCTLLGMDEVIKVELLNFTADRFGDKKFIVHEDFPRIENHYNLLLYKLKALCDRTDTIKDLFDIYFLFKELEALSIKTLFLDLEMKFLETTGYVYNVMSVVNALKIPRRWDIILAGDEQMHHPMKEAIKNFQNDFSCVLLDADTEILDFSYETYLKDKVLRFNCDSSENYLSFYEENAFVEQECRRYLEGQ